MTVDESFAYCRRIAKERARNFYYSFLLLDQERKDAMCAVYAFMRYSDDVSDELEPPIEARRAALQAWRVALERALAGDAGDDPILPAFAATVDRYGIPANYFLDLIDGVEMDLDPHPFTRFEDLYAYCYRVASVVGLTVVHIFGYEGETALDLAEKCGIGFQLTNILRDVPEDAVLGRVYLPQEDLDRFRVSREDLLVLGGGAPAGAGFRELMAFEWERARRYYAESAPLLDHVRPASRPALWAMIAIYYGILRKIRALGYDVYRERPRLTALQKSWIVARASRARWMGGALPFPA